MQVGTSKRLNRYCTALGCVFDVILLMKGYTEI